MTVLNDLDKKLTALGKNVSEKIGSITSTPKTEDLINAENQKIHNLYVQAGQQLIQQNAAELNSAEYRELYQKIKTAEQKIRELSQMAAVAKYRVCSTCGAQIPEGCSFCQSCGSKVTGGNSSSLQGGNQSVSQPVYCIKCGAAMEPDQKFCIKCGAKTEEQPALQAYAGNGKTAVPEQNLEETELVHPETSADSIPKANLCSSCGAELADGQLFCIKCGQRLS